MLQSVNILGIRVQSGKVDDVIAHIDSRLAAREATRVAFLNAHLSNVCSSENRLKNSMDSFFVLNDGVGLDIARTILYGSRFEYNLNGTDFTPDFLDSTENALRLYLLGAKAEVVAQAAEQIERRWPRHTVVGYRDGFFSESEAPAIAAEIKAAKVDLVLVGMGSPRQENWIADNIPDVAPCGMAIGAWFDFVSQTIPRAPVFWRKARLEWVYRLMLEPKRLAKRYLIGNGVFLMRLSRQRILRARQHLS